MIFGMNVVKEQLRRVLGKRGYELRKKPTDFGENFMKIHERIGAFTMTSIERQFALYQAVNYISTAGIEGDVVECGVWRGGSTMLCALTLAAAKDTGRTLYLYDTFAGMSEPTKEDVNLRGFAAVTKWRLLAKDSHNAWDYAPLGEVQTNLRSTEYPEDRCVFVAGKVEDTIPATKPAKIALLRLDTDWYESTKHELEHLFPLLVPGGVLIIDDYGHWQGARQAVDEYFASRRIPILLNRIDYTGRLAVKVA